MAGAGPVFEVEGALARILVDDCVIAPAGNSLPTLVAIDSPRNLTWRGRSNLYGRMRTYLEPMQKGEGAETIDDFGRWKDTPSEVREVDTVLATTLRLEVAPTSAGPPHRTGQPDSGLPARHGVPEVIHLSGPVKARIRARLADPVRLAGRLGASGTGTAKSGSERASDLIHSAATVGAQTAVPKNAGDSSAGREQCRLCRGRADADASRSCR